MKKLYLFLILMAATCVAFGQSLKPSIGLGSLPSNAATICAIPTYTGSFATSGYQAGDTIPHFQLYDKNGVATDVLTVLQTGKPLLLIGGSYTCPVFRQKITKINNVAATFTNQVNIYVIYVVEAHPNTPDPSPYSGAVWTTSENQSESILYPQPTSYGGRKQVLNDMLANNLYTLSVPVLIDGPCNAWWQNFGPAPNNAYLIKPNGVIFKKHGWFDKNPDNIVNDINALLTLTGVEEETREVASVYPNPATSTLRFSFGSPQRGTTVQICNSLGKEIFNEANITGGNYELDIKDFEAGIYFYSVKNSGFVSTGKIIVE
jgi:hypothetical protein